MTRIPSIRLPGVAPTSDRHSDYNNMYMATAVVVVLAAVAVVHCLQTGLY